MNSKNNFKPKPAATLPGIIAAVRDGRGHTFSAVPARITSAELESSVSPQQEGILDLIVELELAGGTTTKLRYRNVESSEIRTLLEVVGVANWSRLVGCAVIALFEHTSGKEVSGSDIVWGLTSFMNPGLTLSLPKGTVLLSSESDSAVTPTNS